MFTGLVQDIGVLGSIRKEGGSVHLSIRTRLGKNLQIGDSLAVNGVCLTISTQADDLVTVTAVPETLSKTSLGILREGAGVNLEPALRLGERLGGHIVQGHVDGVGTLARVEEKGLSRELSFEVKSDIVRYIAHKGSIAVDGVSLTVARLDRSGFSVAIIPHTLGATTLKDLRVGEPVNLEVDILAKYVERLLGKGSDGPGSITEEWLREQGF
jgi:riboflavin synthase